MIRWLAIRMIARHNFRTAWTGRDMDDWECSYKYWTRRAEWWGDWL